MNRSDERTAVLMGECLAALKAEYPTGRLFQVHVGSSLGERHDGIDEDWHLELWEVQVGNERGSGDTPESATEHLRRKLAIKGLVPGAAERVAAILSELPESGFVRDEVVQVAMDMLRRRP